MIPYDSQLKALSNISGLVENQKQYISVVIVIYRIITNAHKPKYSETWNTVTPGQF